MIAKKCLQVFQMKHCISILCRLYQNHRNKLQKIYLFSLLQNQLSISLNFSLSNRNVTNDRGLFCKYEGIFSACVLYPDGNLTLSDTYFQYNFGRNLEIKISRSSPWEQFLNSINASCFRSPLILFVPLLVLQDIRSFGRKKRHQRSISRYYVPTKKEIIVKIPF